MDKYDKAISYLTEHPGEIEKAWLMPSTYEAGCLFRYCTPTGRAIQRPDGRCCGCLTAIRLNSSGACNAWTDALTEEIRADSRIPKYTEEITVADLPVFAEWQRRLDKEIRGQQ